VGFELTIPVFERAKTVLALDRATAVIVSGGNMNEKSTPRIKYFLNEFFVVLFIFYTRKPVIAALIVLWLLLHGVEMLFPSLNILSIEKFQTKFGAYFTK
jgi:hypothetical protein